MNCSSAECVSSRASLSASFTRADCGYRLDLLVEGAVVAELKSIERFDPIHTAQILTYLRLSGVRVGLLINFNVPLLKQGLRRFIL